MVIIRAGFERPTHAGGRSRHLLQAAVGRYSGVRFCDPNITDLNSPPPIIVSFKVRYKLVLFFTPFLYSFKSRSLPRVLDLQVSSDIWGSEQT